MEKGEDKRSIRQRLTSSDTDEAIGEDWRDIDTCPDEDPSINFEAPVKERMGGDELSLYLAFTPTDMKSLSTTHFKSYLVNDSNYFVHFAYAVENDKKWSLKAVGELEPNMKLLIEDFTLADLNGMLHGCIQFHAYKKDKVFTIKPACDIQVNIDAVKFYKLNTFHESVFFDQPALVYTLVEKDRLTDHPMLEPLTKKPQDEATAKLKAGCSSPSRLSEEYQLDVFRRTVEEYKAQRGKKLIFIHGKGEGVLRHAIIHELNYRYKHYSYQDASFREYGYGATQVTIR